MEPKEAKGSKKVLILEDHEYLMKTLENLNVLRKSKQFCDAILQVGSSQDVHEIHAHKVVLASASPYLLDLFARDPQAHLTATYKLNGAFDLSAFKSLVDYAYTSRLEVVPEKLKTVYTTAKKLKMHAVAKQCRQHLITSLSPSNCIGIRSIPALSVDREFQKSVDSFIKKNMSQVAKSQELLSLPQVQVELLQSSLEEIEATNSRHLCEMILDWMENSFSQDFNLDLLCQRVHMLYLNEDHSLHDCTDIENGEMPDSELIQDYKKLSRRLSTPASSKNGKGLGAMVNGGSTPSKPRNFLYTKEKEKAEVVIPENGLDDKPGNLVEDGDVKAERNWKVIATTFTGDHCILGLVKVSEKLFVLSILQRLNTPLSSAASSRNGSVEKTDCYTMITPMSAARCAIGTGDLQGKLIVCGGYDRGECLTMVEVYDEESNEWSPLKSMREPRGRFNIAVIQDKVYAIGGCDGTKELDSAEFYDLEKKTWKRLPPMPHVRSNAGVCNLDGKVCMIGGGNGQGGLTTCSLFDPETNLWSSMAPLLIGRYQVGTAASNGVAYAVGGCDTWTCLNSVEKYSTETDTWRMVAPMTTARRGCGVAIYNGKLYVVGGHDGVHSLCSVEIYDPTTNVWSLGPSLTTCRANVGVCVVGERLYAVGGFTGKTFLNTLEFLDCQTNTWTTFVTQSRQEASTDSAFEKVC